MEEYLKCPITLSIFSDPVSANDGHIYEKEALENFLETSETKKIFSTPITNFYRNYTMRMLIESILSKSPELKKEQYVLKTPLLSTVIDLFLKKDYDSLHKLKLNPNIFL